MAKIKNMMIDIKSLSPSAEEISKNAIKYYEEADGSFFCVIPDGVTLMPYIISKKQRRLLKRKINKDISNNKQLKERFEKYQSYARENIYVPDNFPGVAELKKKMNVAELSRLCVQKKYMIAAILPHNFNQECQKCITEINGFLSSFQQCLSENRDCCEILQLESIIALCKIATKGFCFTDLWQIKNKRKFNDQAKKICQALLNNKKNTAEILSDTSSSGGINSLRLGHRYYDLYLRLFNERMLEISNNKQMVRLIYDFLNNNKLFKREFNDFCNQRHAGNLREIRSMSMAGQKLFNSCAMINYMHEVILLLEKIFPANIENEAEKLPTVAPQAEILKIEKLYKDVVESRPNDSVIMEFYDNQMESYKKAYSDLNRCMQIYRESDSW